MQKTKLFVIIRGSFDNYRSSIGLSLHFFKYFSCCFEMLLTYYIWQIILFIAFVGRWFAWQLESRLRQRGKQVFNTLALGINGSDFGDDFIHLSS